MVVDVINTANKNLRKINPQSINDIHKHDRLIVDFSDKMKKIDRANKRFFANAICIITKRLLVNTSKGKKIIYDLFKYLSKNPRKHINSKSLFVKRTEKNV